MNINEFLNTNKNDIEGFINLSNNAAQRADYIQGGGGNTSVKLANGLMAIKASGFSMGQVSTHNAYAVLNAKLLQDFYLNTNPADLNDIEAEGSAKAKEATVKIEGLPELRPSVEAGFHSILGKFVLHSHSVYANLLSCSKESKQLLSKALEGADYSFVLVPYVNPGAVLTFTINNIIQKYRQETGTIPIVLIMENHGIIVHGETFIETENIHHDANQRIARFFGVKKSDFPKISVAKAGELYQSDTPWLKNKLLENKYSSDFFMNDSLYPDQLVFLANNIQTVGERSQVKNSGVKCTIVANTGDIFYHCPESEALVIEQTLCCVIFIVEHIAKKELTLQLMDSSDKNFIAGWESEAYRKSLLK